MSHVTNQTNPLGLLHNKCKRDGLRIKLHLDPDCHVDDAVFILAVHDPHHDPSLLEVKTKNIYSAANRILEQYHKIRPDEAAAA
jgi:hypothetical protein